MASRAELLAELRARGTDPGVVEAVGAVPREAFVPPDLAARAWEDVALPIGEGQTISQPSLVAFMCETLALTGRERVLDVGTGSGWHAAVLRRLAARVVSIERRSALSAAAAAALDRSGERGVELVVGDGTLGHPAAAPYDAINVAAAAPGDVPPALVEQLADRGRLVAPVGIGEQRLVLLRREGGEVVREDLGGVRFVPLVAGVAGASAGGGRRGAR